MNNWFLCKVRGTRTAENGKQEAVSEQYLVEALTFGEAETCVMAWVIESGMPDVVMRAVTRTKVQEVVLDKYGIGSQADALAKKMLHQNENMTGDADKWFMCKLYFLEVNEKTGKTKKNAQWLLIGAGSVSAAHDVVDNHMKGGLVDYFIEKIDETPIVGVLKNKE